MHLALIVHCQGFQLLEADALRPELILGDDDPPVNPGQEAVLLLGGDAGGERPGQLALRALDRDGRAVERDGDAGFDLDGFFSDS